VTFKVIHLLQSPFECDFSYSRAAADKISTVGASRGPSATAERHAAVYLVVGERRAKAGVCDEQERERSVLRERARVDGRHETDDVAELTDQLGVVVVHLSHSLQHVHTHCTSLSLASPAVYLKAKFHYASWFEAGRRPASNLSATNHLA